MQGRHGVHSLFGSVEARPSASSASPSPTPSRAGTSSAATSSSSTAKVPSTEILLRAPSDVYRLHPPRRPRVPRLDHRASPRRAACSCLTAEGFAVTTRDHEASRTGYVFAKTKGVSRLASESGAPVAPSSGRALADRLTGSRRYQHVIPVLRHPKPEHAGSPRMTARAGRGGRACAAVVVGMRRCQSQAAMRSCMTAGWVPVKRTRPCSWPKS